ncbi:MBL fold metallo-hydrolase [Desulfosporosinus fructosivorans]
MSFFLLTGCGSTEKTTTPSTAPTQTDKGSHLQVHFLNVGQADSILVIVPNGQTILIDGGNGSDGSEVVNYLKSQGVKELTAIVATHPHEDHIGGLDTIIQSYPPKQVYMPNATSTTKTFEDFIKAVNASGAKKIRAKAGVKLDVSEISGLFLAPNSDQYEDLNNYSAVLKISFGKVSFMLTGDAEAVSEVEMLKNGQDLQATVLKVGHHGSSSSTTSAFLNAISPKYSVISVGLDNDYGHPTQVTLNRLTNAGVPVYRTDQDGTIVATSDGDTVKFTTSSSSTSPKPAQPIPTIATGSLAISTIDLSGEVVTILNSSDQAVNLTGWKLVSEVGNQTYTFPSGTTILASETLKVISGGNAQSGSGVLVWTDSNIWNNDGDSGALYNVEGQMVSRK